MPHLRNLLFLLPFACAHGASAEFAREPSLAVESELQIPTKFLGTGPEKSTLFVCEWREAKFTCVDFVYFHERLAKPSGGPL